jgi:hypothetical protein
MGPAPCVQEEHCSNACHISCAVTTHFAFANFLCNKCQHGEVRAGAARAGRVRSTATPRSTIFCAGFLGRFLCLALFLRHACINFTISVCKIHFSHARAPAQSFSPPKHAGSPLRGPRATCARVPHFDAVHHRSTLAPRVQEEHCSNAYHAGPSHDSFCSTLSQHNHSRTRTMC